MAIDPNSPVPYAPPSAVMEVVNRFRRGLPAPITLDVLLRAGISQSLAPRTMQALQALDLIDDDGRPTDILEGLRRSPEPEFQKRLAEWLGAAYADVLQYIDPSTADETAIRDAFRNYNPVGQQPRMVTLFTGLFAAAGVRNTERSSAPRAQRSSRSGTTKSRPSAQPTKLAPGWTQIAMHQSSVTPQLPPALAGLMASLPASGEGWTQEKRDQFVKLIGTALDFCFPIVERHGAADNEDGAE